MGRWWLVSLTLAIVVLLMVAVGYALGRDACTTDLKDCRSSKPEVTIVDARGLP